MPREALVEKHSVKRRDERWETLKRRVQLLARLDGRIVRLVEGVHVAQATRVTDPQSVVKMLRARAVLDRATFERALASDRPPIAITRETLATAQRDLRALSTPPALAMARDRKRALARYGEVDRAWLEKKRERIDLLARVAFESATRDPEDWFDGVLELVGLVHGDASAAALDQACLRLTSLGAERRRQAQERIDTLLAVLETGAAPAEADLGPLAERLERARELPGRARRTRVLDVLRKTVAWPTAPVEAVHDLAAPLRGRSFVDAVRDAGRAVVRALPAARDPALREKALGMLAFYGLSFPIANDGVPMLSADDVDRAIAKQADTAEIAASKVTLAQALAIVELPFKKYVRRRVAEWIAEGVEIDLIARACKDGHAEALGRAPNARAARAFAMWATRLVPHYRALGITFELSPELFTHLPRNEDVAVLAVCLMEQTKEGVVGKTPGVDPIAVLDATLGLFQKLPAKAGGILDRLKGTSPGVGRRTFPELAAWLDDDALLDRFVHLAHIAGVPAALTKQLKEDFEHADKTSRERAHLAGLPARHARQEARFATLLATDRTRARVPRKRTKRRLAERIDELLPIAYRRELDGAFREILREAWGISVPSMTQAWRDAVRFWLVIDDNRDLLGRLLREAAAAPGRDVKGSFLKNREWITKVQGRLGIASWLAPRRQELDVEGTRYEIALEEDPLEVLRMGIPFATCLALDNGCNAASTVLNAIDANKRVLYVRGRDGKVVARKLIAITKDLRLVGYNLYVATRGPGERAIRSAVDAMCRGIADELGAPLASTGEPEKIHDGFWYDDGTVPWGEDVDVASYCRALDLAAPPKWFDAIATEARGRSAMDAGDVDAALAVLTRWDSGPANVGVGRWLVERLGEREAVRRAQDHSPLASAILRTLASPDEEGMIRALATATRLDDQPAAQTLPWLLAAFPPSDRLASAVADLAVRAMRVFPRSGDHGLTHMTMLELPDVLDGIAPSFDVLDRIEPAWDLMVANVPGCASCRSGAERRSIGAIVQAYENAPDPDAIVTCLMNRHRGQLSQRVALAIAAKHVLPGGPRALARLASLRPELANWTTMLAARLRQEAIVSISDALAKKLPRPTLPPFAVLGELLFTCEGIERVVEEWPVLGRPGETNAADTWDPSPWELAWFRRRPQSRVHDALFQIAARNPGIATRATELLAKLGDVDRLEELRCRAPYVNVEWVVPRPPPSPYKSADTWKGFSECLVAASAVARQVAAARAGRLPESLDRGDVVDRSLLAIAIRTLEDPQSPAPHRAVALDVVSAWPSRQMRWDPLLVALAAQGDEVGLRRIVDEKVANGILAPDVVGRLWQVEGIREVLAASLAKNASDDWSAHTTAYERAAALHDPPRDVDGLFEACALAMVELANASTAAETETLDQLRTVIRVAAASATPLTAVALYEELLDDLSASLFVKAVKRLPRDRAAALREAAGKLRFLGERGAARKAWLVATRSLKKSGSSSIERE
jgi:hypothetical protein